MVNIKAKTINEIILYLYCFIEVNSKNGKFEETYPDFRRELRKSGKEYLDSDYDKYIEGILYKDLEKIYDLSYNKKLEFSLEEVDNFSSHESIVRKKCDEVKTQFKATKKLTNYLIDNNKEKPTNLTSLINKELEVLALNYHSPSFEELSDGFFRKKSNLINLPSSIIFKLFYLNTLKKKDIFAVHSSLIGNILQTEYKVNSSKLEIFGKPILKLAFKIIILRCLELKCLFSAFDINEFWFNPLEGLKLWEVSSIEYYGNKIHHILRCDDCHEEVEYYFESFFKSSSVRQESEFVCPNCGKHYTYSQLKRIYEKNLAKAYKDNQEER